MLVNLYRAAIIQVFNGYFEEFENITDRMLEMRLIDEDELEMFSSEICLPIVENVTERFGERIHDLKVRIHTDHYILIFKVMLYTAQCAINVVIGIANMVLWHCIDRVFQS